MERKILNYLASKKVGEIKRSRPDLDLLSRAYEDIFKQTLSTSCDNCIDDALFRIKYYLKNEKREEMVRSKNNSVMKKIKSEELVFRFKPGNVIWVPNFGFHLTNDNLTNEFAIRLLKLNKGNIVFFEKYPKNWRQLVSGEADKPIEKDVVSKTPIQEKTSEDDSGKPEMPVPTVEQLYRNYTVSQLKDKLSDVDYPSNANKTDLCKKYIEQLKKQK